MGLGGGVDDRIGALDERTDDLRVRDVAVDEGESPRLLLVGLDGGQVRAIAGVGQGVEDGDPCPVPARHHLTDQLRADEPGAARDEQVRRGSGRIGHSRGRSTGGARRPARSSTSASSAARSRLGTVPASAQWPS